MAVVVDVVDDKSIWQTFRAWPGPARWASYLAVVVALLLIAVTVVGVVLVRRPLPQTDGEVELPGLSGSVEVIRDEHGIPHLYADTTEDLVRAQGYVHAQERFFEMDVRRHVTAGRVSELFGADGLATDKVTRTLGWRRVAEREVALLEPETRSALEAYADGVNAYLDQRDTSEISVEYTLLRLDGLEYHPEPWTPVDSLAWLKAMAWDLRGNMDDEIQRVLLAVDVGRDRARELYPPYDFEEHEPIVGRGAVVDGVFEQDAVRGGTRNPVRPPWTADQLAPLRAVADAADAMPDLLGSGEGIGSNSWVVDGAHSSTGEPLLANDPHLGISLPGIWMQVGLHCREVSDACRLDVSGFSFSGVPGVVIGHNADIAWGFTNLGPDVSDLFLEKVRGKRWRYGRKWRPLQIRHETIRIRGGEDFRLTVRETDHGPLLSDVSTQLSTVGANAAAARPGAGAGAGGYAVALRWTALDPAPTADAIFKLNTATDWRSFREAAADFAVPAQNLVYADREGHIGYQAPGRIPIRKSGNDGRMPTAGWRPENDWTGEFVPYDALPRLLDPDEGFVATANQAVIGEDYPFHLTSDWDFGYRAQRIRDRLAEEGELSPEDMAALQLDDLNPMAPVLVPYLLDVRLPRGYASAGQRLLADWDYRQPAESPAAAYYNVVWRNLLELTFHDELREDTRPEGGGRWFAVMTRLLEEPDSLWWDDVATESVQETRDDILEAALLEARDELTRRQSLRPQEWEWGRLHTLDLRSSTLGESGVAPIERLFNREGHRIGGGGAIVNATSWKAVEGYQVTASPSMRMVVSLADFDQSRWVNLTGVSGHAGSDHYVDQTELFVAGETLPWAFSREAVEAAGEDTLVLVPAAEE